MILELVATCILAAGTVYTPPDGWTIERVGIQGTLNPCTQAGPSLLNCLSIYVTPVEQSFVTLRRPAKVGETIAAPPGCDVMVEAK